MGQSLSQSSVYQTLLARVRETLLDGQKRIEAEKIRTYWQTGKLIHEHILKNQNRAEYGGEVVVRLSQDLNVDKTTLHDCIQFAKSYPNLQIVRGREQFKWSHFRKLSRIPDETLRERLEAQVQHNGWTADELISQIKAQRLSQSTERISDQSPASSVQRPLTALRGELYTYKIVERPTVGNEDEGLMLDAGFKRFGEFSSKTMAKFKAGDIVESRRKNGKYQLHLSNRTAKDLYTYAARVEKVIDGDTIKVRFDLGFGWWGTETLRLRGLDCPELDTKEGQAARTFVQSYIKEADTIIVRSSRSDKYDRYLADVFIQQASSVQRPALGDLYLNNLLLESGHARRYEI